jgi:hypothetical protein
VESHARFADGECVDPLCEHGRSERAHRDDLFPNVTEALCLSQPLGAYRVTADMWLLPGVDVIARIGSHQAQHASDPSGVPLLAFHRCEELANGRFVLGSQQTPSQTFVLPLMSK